MKELICRLKGSFGERLCFVGLQGSRARGETRDNNDIDAVIVVEGLNVSDLDEY